MFINNFCLDIIFKYYGFNYIRSFIIIMVLCIVWCDLCICEYYNELYMFRVKGLNVRCISLLVDILVLFFKVYNFDDCLG